LPDAAREISSAPTSLTKTEAAFRAVRMAIEDGRFAPGERLRVSAIVEALGMSPTPIREALRLLQAEGLVKHHPHRGMVVAEFSTSTMEEIHRLRVLLEPLAAELATVRAGDAEVREMRRLHDVLQGLLASDDVRRMAELNAAWHKAIHAAAASPHLSDFIDRLWTSIPVPALWLTRRAQLSVEQHGAVMEAIERRDAPAASAAMRAHIESGFTSMMAHLDDVHGRAGG
jgi:DNA-binding GntR family transcriptional regulator